jgi:hypothetical protein
MSKATVAFAGELGSIPAIQPELFQLCIRILLYTDRLDIASNKVLRAYQSGPISMDMGIAIDCLRQVLEGK